jgi:hypothetical protein
MIEAPAPHVLLPLDLERVSADGVLGAGAWLAQGEEY